MNKILPLLLFFQSFCLSATAQVEHWQRISLDDSTSIEFPGEPKKKLSNGQQATFFQNDKAIYSIIVGKDAYGGNPIDSELERFYTGTLKGMMDAFGGGEIIDEKPFVIDSFSGKEIRFTTPSKPQLPPIKTVRFLLANGTFYTTNFWTNTNQDPEVDSARNHFFSSFQTRMKKTAAVDPETQTGAYRLGSMLGSLFFYGALIAVFVAVVRRFSKSKAA